MEHYTCSHNQKDGIRRYNPDDITLPPGYRIEIIYRDLDSPIGILFTDDGDLVYAESGMLTGSTKIWRLVNNNFEVIAENFNVPVTGIAYLNGEFYVSHKSRISVIRRDGSIEDIIAGLPCNGDYVNNQIAFGPDRKLYFGMGTATNSGVVGTDNEWALHNPFFHDISGSYIMLNGQNYETPNILSPTPETSYTGAFSPFGVPNMPFEIRKGHVRASGSILRANLDGSELELFAWGFRNPFGCKFDRANRLFVSNQSYDVRGSRPIANAPDEFHLVTQGYWYGWPDFAGSQPVTLPRFRPEGRLQPEFLMTNHPNIPPRPFTLFPTDSTVMGFDFNYNSSFGNMGDVYISEFGSLGPRTLGEGTPYAGIGHRVSKIDIATGGLTTFAMNKSGFPVYMTGEGGFGRPCDIRFGPDGAMYILDYGISIVNLPYTVFPHTGAIWRISRI